MKALKQPVFDKQEESKRQVEKTQKSAEDLVVDVNCTLKELYNGCMKTITYK